MIIDKRITTGIGILLIIGFVFFLSKYNSHILPAVGVILMIACVYEYLSVIEKQTVISVSAQLLFYFVLLLAPILVFLNFPLNITFLISTSFALGVLLFFSRENVALFNHWLIRIAPAILLISFGGASLLYLSANINLLLLVILITTLNDVTAYEMGSVYQGPKFAPAISPKKTIIGSVLGIVAGVFAGSIFVLSINRTLSCYQIICLLIAVILAQQGDLLKSVVKREHDIKDFGDSLPGHGGILDRLDGILLASIAIATLDVL